MTPARSIARMSVLHSYAARVIGPAAGVAVAGLNLMIGDGSVAEVSTAVETLAFVASGLASGLLTERLVVSRRTVNDAIDEAKGHLDDYISRDTLDRLDEATRDAIMSGARAAAEDAVRRVTGVDAAQR